jgi:hypothetical protein
MVTGLQPYRRDREAKEAERHAATSLSLSLSRSFSLLFHFLRWEKETSDRTGNNWSWSQIENKGSQFLVGARSQDHNLQILLFCPGSLFP